MKQSQWQSYATTMITSTASIAWTGYVGFTHGRGESLEPSVLNYSPFAFSLVPILFDVARDIQDTRREERFTLENAINDETSEEDKINLGISVATVSIVSVLSYGIGFGIGYFTK